VLVAGTGSDKALNQKTRALIGARALAIYTESFEINAISRQGDRMR
jgi:hypothetical protein